MAPAGQTRAGATCRQRRPIHGAQRVTVSIRPEPFRRHQPRNHGSLGWGGAPLGLRGGICTAWMPVLARIASNDCGELPGPAADQEPEVRGPLAEVHQEVADLLHSPRPVWVHGDPEYVHVAGADLHDEQAVQALEGHRAVHMKEVGGKRCRGMRVQDLSPGRLGVPRRRGRDLQGFEDRPDGGCANSGDRA
jgi:hypothetical protein